MNKNHLFVLVHHYFINTGIKRFVIKTETWEKSVWVSCYSPCNILMFRTHIKYEKITSNLYHSVLFQWGFSDLRQTSVLCVILPNFISTNASVVSLARSITGRFRPAKTFTLIFPGIFTYLHPHLTLKQQFNNPIHTTLFNILTPLLAQISTSETP